jgi:hypothetical protein
VILGTGITAGVVAGEVLFVRAPVVDAVSLSGDGYSISATGDTVTLVDPSGRALLVLGGYRIGNDMPTGGQPKLGAALDGTASIVVQQTVGAATVDATYTPRGRRLEVTFDIRAPKKDSLATGYLRRWSPPGVTAAETSATATEWTRDPRGGVPFEQTVATLYQQKFADDLAVYIALKGSRSQWTGEQYIHCPADFISTGRFTVTANLTVESQLSLRTSTAAGRAVGATLVAEAWCDQPYKLWKSATTATVHGSIYARNASVSVHWTARDFDGRVVAERTTDRAVPTDGLLEDDFPISLSGRGIVFIELTVSSGTDIALSRTSIGLLPPHDFDEGLSSIFGISANFLLDTVDERALLKRLGMRWSRNAQFTADQLHKYGWAQNRLRTPASLDQFEHDPNGKSAYIAGELEIAQKAHARIYELANEWNLTGGVRSGAGATRYVTDWIIPFARAIKDLPGDASTRPRLMSGSLAGMDEVYANKMFDAGLGHYIDAFGLHPARGNVTADFDPQDEEAASTADGYWTYLGSIRAANRLLAERTPKGRNIQLWLTEAYACTQPNSWWHDSYRHAAENVLLSLALGLAEGVRNVQWFQLYDSLKSDVDGAELDNAEYHYGLVMRDHGPKPSLFAYAAAAEALDGAQFRRWLTLPGEANRGLLFDTPRGTMSVLWSRADGYRLNTATTTSDFYPSHEPWVDPWTTKARLSLPAAGSTVTAYDCIGRRSAIPVVRGRAEIKIDGSPRIFYGLDPDPAPVTTAR